MRNSSILPGILRASVKFVDSLKTYRVNKKHGPMEKWGAAKCDNEILDIVYAPDEPGSNQLNLDIFFNNHKGLQPIVVNIHGGGWMFGDKSQIQEIFRSRFIANNGYVVANVNYRLYPDYPIRTQIEDVLGAVLWIKEHAAEYGADPKRIGVTGDSAGGHLAAMVAWAGHDQFFTPTVYPDSRNDLDVLAAVAYFGVFDFERVLKKNPIIKIIGRYTGLKSISKIRNGAERGETIRHISPKHHLSPQIPPTFFICGDKDEFGLYSESVNFNKYLQDHGVETGLYTAKGAKHAFEMNYAADYTQEAMRATVEWFDKYLA